MKKIFGKMSILTTIFVLLTSFVLPQTIFAKPSVTPLATTSGFTLTIMHTNDSHGTVTQRPKLATAVKQIRVQNPYTLLVDSGDVFYGSAYFNKYLGLADLWFMNDIRYDAMTLGNHEFDKGSTVLRNFIKGMSFPMVSTNVNVTKDPSLAPMFKSYVSSYPGGYIYPSIIKYVNGEKIGIIGLTTIYYSFPPIIFQSPYDTANAAVQTLKSKGVNKIVVLSHLGFDVDQKLATKVPGIDIIVGGHNHTAIQTPFVVNKTEPTVIVQAGSYLQYLGLLNVTFNSNGVVTAQNGKLLNLNNYAPDPIEQAKVNEFKVGLYK